MSQLYREVSNGTSMVLDSACVSQASAKLAPVENTSGSAQPKEDRAEPPWIVLQPMLAAIKACDILIKGARTVSVAAHGTWSMTLDDGLAVHRARFSCRSLASLLALEQDLAPRMLGRAVCRLCLVARMALQLCEEAIDPPQRCIALAFELLDPAGLA